MSAESFEKKEVDWLDLEYLNDPDVMNENTSLNDTRKSLDLPAGTEINIKENFNKTYNKVKNWSDKEKQDIKQKLLSYVIFPPIRFHQDEIRKDANSNGEIHVNEITKSIEIHWKSMKSPHATRDHLPPDEKSKETRKRWPRDSQPHDYYVTFYSKWGKWFCRSDCKN